jgi:hypothetical protein
MQISMTVLVQGSILWRVLVAAAVIGARVSLDEIVPRGRVCRRRWSSRQ